MTRKSVNDRILTISDLHAPFMHKDTVPFLAGVKAKYKPTRIILTGDERDGHNESFHETDPNLPGAADELDLAVKQLKPLYKLFPVVDIMESNHGSLAYRRARAAGLPEKHIRPYREVLQAPKGWVWHFDLLIKLPTGEDCYFHHGLSSDVMKVVNQRGMCVVQGHYHNTFKIGYSGNPNSLLWGMQVGCSIDANARAFEYGKNTLGRPIIGHGIIINGLPRLLPMVLKKNGRWNGEVP
jgi:hypothetical protein